ncbi:hypothetical protein [uncultured Methylobacterium sp.]|jgi:hypothetical protein|uniref:hypothetical protein n=1 Tax=uncultured Methylobacterium sp. TaxID=157278 RepID=UPI00262DEE21|nr:hypothetical protein [uncultured Methylobacterium sp.]
MTTEIDRLVVSLEANIGAYERELARAAPAAERAVAEIERRFATGGTRIAGAMARTGAALREEVARMAGARPRGADDETAYRGEADRIARRTALLRIEAETVGQSEAAAAKAEAAYRLLEAAKRADLAVTPALREEIDRVAAAYGAASEQAAEAEEAQRRFLQSSRDLGASLAEGLKGAVLKGEALSTVLSKLSTSLASRAIDRGVEGLFGRGGAGTGLFGDLLGGLGLNPTGRAEGGPVSPGIAYTVGERGRETFVPLQPGRILPAATPAPPQAPRPIQVSVVVHAADAPSFARAEGQITAALARAVQRGTRSL